METTIPSYFVSRESENISILSRQRVTRNWWNTQRDKYELFISEIVLEEIEKGDRSFSKLRIELLKDIRVLPVNEGIRDLVKQYMAQFHLSETVIRDIFHIAFAVYYKIDYLLTWNCKHIANAHFIKQIVNYNINRGLYIPEICTPEQLLEE